MKDIQQLIKKNSQEGRYEDVFPKTFTDAVEDRESGNTLTEILSGFNMYFLSYNGSRELTRLQVPMSIRKTGLWITYVLFDKTVVTEWYAGEAIDDDSWGNDSNWRNGSNALVGDISISSDGYWMVNGVVTTTKAQGEQGITPMLRVGSNNYLQASYTNGSSWVDVSTNPVYTQFRINNNKLEQSVDLGTTWIVVSDELAYQFRNSGNKLQVSKDLGVTWEDVSEELAYKFRESGNKLQMSKDLGNTWEDVSDYIAAWFRWQANDDNLGRIQISRDNNTWENFSPEFINRMLIKGFVANLPQSAEYGDIYMVGPYYNQEDSEHVNPYYRMWVMQDTWVDAGDYNKNTYNFNYNIKKTYLSASAMDSDKNNPIGTNGLAIQIGDIVTVVNSTTPSENGIYSYEGATNGWKYQSSFNFQVEQSRSQNVNTSPSSKLFDDELFQVYNYIKYTLQAQEIISKLITSNGSLADSTTQHLLKFNVVNGVPVAIHCYLYAGSAIGLYAFYNSDTVFDETTLVQLGPVTNNGLGVWKNYNVSTPSGAVTLLVTARVNNPNKSYVEMPLLSPKFEDIDKNFNTIIKELDAINSIGIYRPTDSELSNNVGYVSGSVGQIYSVTSNLDFRYKIYDIPRGCSVVGITYVGSGTIGYPVFLDSENKVVKVYWTPMASDSASTVYYRELVVPNTATKFAFNTKTTNKHLVVFRNQPLSDYPCEIVSGKIVTMTGELATLNTHNVLKLRVVPGQQFINTFETTSGDTSITNKALYAFYNNYDNPSQTSLVEAVQFKTADSRDYWINVPLGANTLLLSVRNYTAFSLRSSSLNPTIKPIDDKLSAQIAQIAQIDNVLKSFGNGCLTISDKSLLVNSGLVGGDVGSEYTVSASGAGYKYAIIDIPVGKVNCVESYMHTSSQNFNILFINNNNIIIKKYNINTRLYEDTNNTKVKFPIPSGATKFITGCVPSSQDFYVQFSEFAGVPSRGVYRYTAIIEDGSLGTEGTESNYSAKAKVADVRNSESVYIQCNPRNGNTVWAAAFYSSLDRFDSSTFITGVGSCRTAYNTSGVVERICDVPKNAKALIAWSRRENGIEEISALNEPVVYVSNVDNIEGVNKTNSIFDVNVPAEIEQLLIQSKRAMNLNGGTTLENEPLTLQWFSDIHSDELNVARLLEFHHKFKAYIDDILHTGDGHNYSSAEYCTLNEVEGAEIILDCIGNHDAYDGEHGTPLSPISEASDVYESQWEDRISNWNVVQPTDALGDVKKVCYYYKDYINYHIRLIVLDEYHLDEDQKQWFSDVLDDARENGLSVIAASHFIPDVQIDCFDCSFSEVPQMNKIFDASSVRNQWAAVVVDSFINNGGEFICWLAGHWHRDFIGTAHNHPEQIIIVCTTDRVAMYGANDMRVRYTKTQDAFNVISFDTSLKLIKIIRIGNEYDPFLRHKQTLCVDYDNKKVIADGSWNKSLF